MDDDNVIPLVQVAQQADAARQVGLTPVDYTLRVLTLHLHVHVLSLHQGQRHNRTITN